MRTRSGRHGPDRGHTAGEQPERGEQQGEDDGTGVLPGVRPGEQPHGSRERGHPEPLHGDAPASGPVVDPGEHGAERGEDPDGGPPQQHGREQQRSSGQRPSQHRVPGHRSPLRTQSMSEPGRQDEGSGAGHGAPVVG